MDKLSVQHGHRHGHHGISKPPVHRGGKGRAGTGKGGIKVVYISSPMKLTASAEEFRAVVQELTGRDSNVADHDAAIAPSSTFISRGALPLAVSTRAGADPPQTTEGGGGRATRAQECGAAVTPPFQSMYEQSDSLLFDLDFW